MAIAKATLITDIWNTIYTAVTDATNGIDDTRGTPRTIGDWVFSSFPDANDAKSKFPGYPIVVFTVSLGNFTGVTFDKSLFDTSPVANFDVFTRTSVDYDTLMSDLLDVLTSTTNLGTFHGVNLIFNNIEVGEPDVGTINETKVHVGTLTVSYKWGGSN